MRTTVIVAAVLGFALWAAPAQARMVYVKDPGGVEPAVYVATDRGKNPQRLGIGRAPAIAPNGQWVAFVTSRADGERETVVLQKLDSGSQRVVMSGGSVHSLRFSPDSSKVAAVTGGKRVRVYEIAPDRLHTAMTGPVRGFSFSPDSQRIVFGRAESDKLQAASDLYVAPALGGAATRITGIGRALNPVWGPDEIFFDRFNRRRGDAPAFNLWAVEPEAGGALRRLTRLMIPRLVSGLVPLEVSADSRRLLSVFTGQNTEVGFTVAARTGRTRALSRDFENGLVGFDLSADGKRILAHTGGWDPSAAHDVVSVPYGGGRPKVLVEDAAYPDWTR